MTIESQDITTIAGKLSSTSILPHFCQFAEGEGAPCWYRLLAFLINSLETGQSHLWAFVVFLTFSLKVHI